MKPSRLFSVSIVGLALVAALSGCSDNVNPFALGQELDTTPPPAPTGLTVYNDASGRPVLTWIPSPAPDVAGYHVQVANTFSPSSDADFMIVADPDPSDNVYQLPSVQVTTEAAYRVRAVDTSGNASGFSPSVSFLLTAPGGGGGPMPFEM